MRRKRLLVIVTLISFCLWAINYFLAAQCVDCFEDERLEVKYKEHPRNLENINKLENVPIKNTNRHTTQSSTINLVSNNIEKIKIFDGNDRNSVFNNEDRVLNYKSLLLRPHNITKQETSSSLQQIEKSFLSDGRPVIAILVLTCDRVSVKRSLDRLIRYRPSKEQFPIIVSQDCKHKNTTKVILSYGDEIFWVQHPDLGAIQVPLKEKKFIGYFKIARHYGWALNRTFFTHGFSTVIIVEDDLEISEDFFEYFLGTYNLLKTDPTLWCVSAWNDNGNSHLVDASQPHLLYRTDFFPGLGWMLEKSLWEELSIKWPSSYWDDWIRKPEQRKDRSCIRPEVSRTKTFGKIGVSNGFFYEKHLKFIKLNENFVEFTKLDLSYLLKENYDALFENQINTSQTIPFSELALLPTGSSESINIIYSTKNEYKKLTKKFGLMDDFKSGVGRTAYKGVVTFWQNSRRIYIAPKEPWTGYNITWS